MLVFRFAAIMMVIIMMSAPSFGQSKGAPAVAPEYEEMVAKRAKERAKIENCHKQANEQKILPRDRPQFVIHCLDGDVGPGQPSVIAPEYREFAEKREKEKERIDNCQKQATERRILPRDRTQFVISCLEK